MGALRPSLENVRRLELKLGQIPAIAFTAATRNEDQAQTPQCRSQIGESHNSIDSDTASAKKLDCLFDAPKTGPLSAKS